MPAPPTARSRTLPVSVLCPLLAATATFTIDRVAIAISPRGAMPWRWIHALTSWAGHAALALAVAALATAALATTLALPALHRQRWPGAVVLPAAAASLLLAAPLATVGNQLASGAWISRQWFGPLLAWAPLASVFIAWLCCFTWLRSRECGPPRRRLAVTLCVAIAATLLVAVNHAVMPGLHPGFHQVVDASLTATTLVLIARLMPRPMRPSSARRRLAYGSAAACALVLWFASTPATRGGLLLRSDFARRWMPSTLPQARSTTLREMLADMDVRTPSSSPEPTQPSTFAGHGDWNIILVVVDTLRADAIPPSRPSEGLPFAQPGDTPRIDAWLQDAYRFEHAYSPASETKRAMPAMLRSIESSEDPLLGVPLGERMAGLGISPLAVVPRYFSPAQHVQVDALLDGFLGVRVYADAQMHRAVPAALQMLSAAGSRRFFVYLHLYTMHRPGFDGKVIPWEVPRIDAYRRSLQYLDQQIGALLDGVTALGLHENTLFVLTSDHGEGLGDHETVLHGPSIFDEDVRVPFAIAVPGHRGHVVRETVGTIDLVPTLVDLLGQEPIPEARGRSLVPLFTREPDEPARIYSFENWDDTQVGLVSGRDKLIYDRRLGVALRFELDVDPDEYDDRHDVEASRPELLRHLAALEPEIVRAELEDDATRGLLLARLDGIDPRATPATLEFLVRLVAVDPRAELVARCVEIFEQADTDVRVLIARHLLAAAPDSMDAARA